LFFNFVDNFSIADKIKLVAHSKTIKEVKTMEDTSEKNGWIKGIIWVFGIVIMITFFVSLIPGFYLGIRYALDGRGIEGWLEYYKNEMESFQDKFQYHFQQYGWWCLIGYIFIFPLLPASTAGMFIGGYIAAALPFGVALGILLLTALILLGIGAEKAIIGSFAVSGYLATGITGAVISIIGIGILIFF